MTVINDIEKRDRGFVYSDLTIARDESWTMTSTWKDVVSGREVDIELATWAYVRVRSDETSIELAMLARIDGAWLDLLESGATLEGPVVSSGSASPSERGRVLTTSSTESIEDYVAGTFVAACGLDLARSDELVLGQTRARVRADDALSTRVFCLGAVSTMDSVIVRTADWSATIGT